MFAHPQTPPHPPIPRIITEWTNLLKRSEASSFRGGGGDLLEFEYMYVLVEQPGGPEVGQIKV